MASDLKKSLTAYPDDSRTLNGLCSLLIFYNQFIEEPNPQVRCKELLDRWLTAAPNNEMALNCLTSYHLFLCQKPDEAIKVDT